MFGKLIIGLSLALSLGTGAAHATEEVIVEGVTLNTYQCTYYGTTSFGLQKYTGASDSCGSACNYARQDCESAGASSCRYSYCGLVY